MNFQMNLDLVSPGFFSQGFFCSFKSNLVAIFSHLVAEYKGIQKNSELLVLPDCYCEKYWFSPSFFLQVCVSFTLCFIILVEWTFKISLLCMHST